MNIAEFAVKRPVAVFFFVLLIVFAGITAHAFLELETFPEMKMPMVMINTVYPGASSVEIEKLVTVPIETRIRSVKDIKKVTSVSSESVSSLTVTFKESVDLTDAITEIRNNLREIEARLPEEATDPVVIPMAMADLPVLIVSLTGNRNPNQLKALAETLIQTPMENIPGVGDVEIHGGTNPYFLIEADQEKLRKFRLSPLDLTAAIGRSKLDIPAGQVFLGDSRFMVRTVGAFETVEDMSNSIVDATRTPPVRVRDVATVVRDFYPNYGISRMNGKPYVMVIIKKASGANVVTVAGRCLQMVEKINQKLPEGTKLIIQYDLSEFVEDQMSQVKTSALIGGLLAMGVLYFFLKSIAVTLIIGLAIPLSILVTLIVMYLNGITLNYMTLAGMILALGMLVDDSIVILENIVRYREQGASKQEAAYKGASEISSAVLASTVTTVIVFAPVFLMGDWGPGVFLKMMAFSLVVAVSASYVVAMTVVPAACAWLTPAGNAVFYSKSGKMAAFGKWYRRMLRMTLRHPIIFTSLFIVLLVVSFMMSMKNGIEGNFSIGNKDIPIYFKFSPGAGREAKVAAFEQMEKLLYGIPEVKNMYGWTDESRNEARLMVSLDIGGAKEEMDAVKNKILPHMNDIPGVKLSFQSMMHMGDQAPVDVFLKGTDQEELEKTSKQVYKILTEIKGLVNVQNMMESGRREIQVLINRERAAALGVSENAIAMTVRTAIFGTVATRVIMDSREIDVLVKLKAEQGSHFQALGNILVRSAEGNFVPLQDLAEIKWVSAVPEIRKKNYQKTVRVKADINDFTLMTKLLAEVKQKIAKLTIPAGVEIEFGGDAKEEEEGKQKLLMIVLLSVFMVYAVMAIQFNSFLHPLIIMVSLPLAFIGSNFSLAIFGIRFSIMAGIGIVLLGGIVVNDAIVLVDYINQLRSKGRSKLYALQAAGTVRLRPIIMTSITTIFGVIPMALGLGHGSEIYVPLGVSLIGGLGFATVLTLVAIPLIYNMSEVAGVWLRGLFSGVVLRRK